MRHILEVVIAVVAIVFISVGFLVGVSHIQANELAELGYETKAINGTCYAKYEGQWLNCDSVIRPKQLIVRDK